MIPSAGMPHPWWMLWQIGDFLVMATLVVLFLRYVLRSSRNEEADPTPAEPAEPADRDPEPPAGPA